LTSFIADVTSPVSFSVPEDAIRPVGTMHLTLGVFSFPKNDGLDRAKELLESLNPRAMLASIPLPVTPGVENAVSPQGEDGPRPGPLTVTLRGLSSMQAPSKTAVLYASPVDPLRTLQGFGEKLKAAFQDAGLMVDESRPLLLHATILNTIYVKGSGGKKKGKGRERLMIDARGILSRYEDQVWMEDVEVEKVAICKMGAKKLEVDGAVDEAYEIEAEIRI
jgi:activating signal cointegrator complex subunit 1